MPVTPRGSSWQAAVSHKGTRLRKDFPTKEEAEIWMHQTLAALKSGQVPARLLPKEPTLADLLKTVSETRWKGKKAEETLITNGTQVVEILGPTRRVSTLTKADADRIKVEMRRRGKSDATINRKLAALSVLVREAVERDQLAKGFTVGLIREREGRIRFLTEAEEDAMLAWCERTGNDDLRDYILVSLDTGFRQGEVLRIEARDCGRPNLWTYDTKAGTNREVPLTARAKGVLERRAYGLSKEACVFNFHPDWIRERWRKMQSAMRLTDDENFVPHVMRHTFVTRLLAQGVDIKTVMELAGHSRIETTQRYAHSSPERKTLAISRLEGYQPAASKAMDDRVTHATVWHGMADTGASNSDVGELTR